MHKVRQKSRKQVPARSTEFVDLVIPAGERWLVHMVVGVAAQDGETRVELVWDRKGSPETVFMTYGTVRLQVAEEFVGDGIKMLSLALINESSRPVTLFGQILYAVLNDG